MIEEIPSSSEGSLVKTPDPAAEPLESPVQGSEEASTQNGPHQTPTPKPVLKRKAKEQPSPATQSPAEPSEKQVKAEVAPSIKLEKFQKRGVMRGKVNQSKLLPRTGAGSVLREIKSSGVV